MPIALDLKVAAATNGIAEADQELQQQCYRIGFRMRRDGLHHFARKAVIGGLIDGRPGIGGNGDNRLGFVSLLRGRLLRVICQQRFRKLGADGCALLVVLGSPLQAGIGFVRPMNDRASANLGRRMTAKILPAGLGAGVVTALETFATTS
jgi:hypothetical protein